MRLHRVKISLLPLGRTLSVESGAPLRDVLFTQGVEFPCGGRGRCKRCRVKVLEGHLPPSPEDKQRLSAVEIASGWRLACQARADGDLKIELAQWEAAVLGDDSRFEFAPRDGLGVAVDLGTTTIVAQLLDLRTGNVMGVRSAMNLQARHGSDVMSRVEFALTASGLSTLTSIAREQIGGMIGELVSDATLLQGGASAPSQGLVDRVTIVGNTVMHHLFSGISVAPLACHPFIPVDDGPRSFAASDLGWRVPGNPTVRFLPCVGGFVGSDVLCGVLATRVHESASLAGLVDLGTNGEIVIGTSEHMLCASTAAGPAFEGARISCGMLATTGAISAVTAADGHLDCQVLGGGEPRGICGSGLVDAVACALELGMIERSGRLANGDRLPLLGMVHLTQSDIRQLQLAKSAIAAGMRLLLDRWGASWSGLDCLWLAGAFGNYISRSSARRIGLLPVAVERVKPAGNTALRGAKLALFDETEGGATYADLRGRIEHVPLNEDARFHDVFVEEMAFP